MLESVLNNSQQIIAEKKGRKAYQYQVNFGGGKIYLIPVIVTNNSNLALVITADRTSKITKYWI